MACVHTAIKDKLAYKHPNVIKGYKTIIIDIYICLVLQISTSVNYVHLWRKPAKNKTMIQNAPGRDLNRTIEKRVLTLCCIIYNAMVLEERDHVYYVLYILAEAQTCKFSRGSNNDFPRCMSRTWGGRWAHVEASDWFAQLIISALIYVATLHVHTFIIIMFRH